MRQSSGAVTGVLLFSLGIFFFAVNDALGKWLVGSYAVGELLLLRSVGALIVLGPMLWLTRPNLDIRDEWPIHLLRVACMAADTFAFYFATRTLPLADVMTFYLAAPLIITALSMPILGERVGAFRWGAVLVGFGGVLVALRPSGAAISSTALIALFGSFMFACAITITRKLRRTHWLTLTTWQFIGAGVVGAVASPAVWITPSWLDLGLMFSVGIVSMACFICITKALNLAPAALLAPFQYASIVWAVTLGWAVFGDIPTLPVLIGSGIIVASGLVVFAREQIRDRTVAQTESVASVP